MTWDGDGAPRNIGVAYFGSSKVAPDSTDRLAHAA